MSSSRSGRHTRHRRDEIHAAVMAKFKALCPVCEDHSQGGHGYDAIIMTSRGLTWVVEIKTGDAKDKRRLKLSANERSAQQRWGHVYKVVQSVDEAINLATGRL